MLKIIKKCNIFFLKCSGGMNKDDITQRNKDFVFHDYVNQACVSMLWKVKCFDIFLFLKSLLILMNYSTCTDTQWNHFMHWIKIVTWQCCRPLWWPPNYRLYISTKGIDFSFIRISLKSRFSFRNFGNSNFSSFKEIWLKENLAGNQSSYSAKKNSTSNVHDIYLWYMWTFQAKRFLGNYLHKKLARERERILGKNIQT